VNSTDDAKKQEFKLHTNAMQLELKKNLKIKVD